MTNTFYIGTLNNAGEPTSTTPQTITHCELTEWVDGVEVPQRTYVPWYRASDGVVCLKNILDGSYCEIVTGTVVGGEPV